jgi:hypothetical protein
MQKRACPGTSAPQDAHFRGSGAPHAMQKRADAGLGAPQLEQLASGSIGFRCLRAKTRLYRLKRACTG